MLALKVTGTSEHRFIAQTAIRKGKTRCLDAPLKVPITSPGERGPETLLRRNGWSTSAVTVSSGPGR